MIFGNSFLVLLLMLLLMLPGSLCVAQPPTSSGSNISILPGHPGDGGGGRVSGGNITMDTATGGAIAGGVSNLSTSNFQTKEGYTGQLYDPVTLAISAAPGPSVDEGDAVQLSAQATMDDDTLLDPVEPDWSVLSGPIATINTAGLAVAGAVSANTAATVQGLFGGITSLLNLNVINLPFESNPLAWDDPAPGGNGPYQVFFGTSPGSMVLVATPASPHFNPGKLEMGTTYFWQILDDSGTDITPGGPGPISFTTNLFQADMRIGLKGNPATHQGNNRINRSGAGQVANLKLKGARVGKLHFSVENDGSAIDPHRVRASRASKKFRFIKYFKLTGGRANITAAAIRSGYTKADVDPGDVVVYQVQAKAKGKSKARQTLRISSDSAGDTRGSDLARGNLLGLAKKKK